MPTKPEDPQNSPPLPKKEKKFTYKFIKHLPNGGVRTEIIVEPEV